MNPDSSNGSLCPTCEDKGKYIDKNNDQIFCSCAIGKRCERLWIQGNERRELEAKSYQQRRARKFKRLVHDYKTKAAGNGERWPGEDNE